MSDQVPTPKLASSALRVALACLLPLLLCAALPVSLATTPISRLKTPWWRERFDEKQSELRQKRVDLLWLGDSITQDWERSGPEPWRNFAPIWQRFYGDRHAINLGFRGDSTCHLLWRLKHGELDGIKPKAAILLVGANNFGHIHTDADQTYEGIVAVIDAVHRRLPTTKVLLIGVLPSIRSQWVSANTRLLNRRLAQLPASEGTWLRYIDVSPVFERNGHVDPARYLDPLLTPPDPPLHPVAAAQADLAAAIEPPVAAMMEDYQHR
jgi:lysophospholipase L1-like esterase